MILLVDDRPENIIPLRKILELHNFRTDSAESGEEALRKILQNSYSVIILDVQMPDMDGFEVAEAMSGYSKARDIPIIFLSAVNTEKKFITKGYETGGIDYLTKPVDPDILLLKVKTFSKLFEQKQALKESQEKLEQEIEIRKRAQIDLQERILDLQSVMESLPQISFTINPDGHVEYVNQHWFNYSDNIATFPHSHPDDKTCERWKEKFEEGSEFSSEVRLWDLTELQYRHFLLKILPIRQNEKIVRWVGTYSDIHQQKMVNELLENKVAIRTRELIRKNMELESTNHELQQFTWVVSHDLKEPLRKVQTFNNMIKDKFLADNPEAISYLDRSISASARMTNLISDLLEYSRLSVSADFKETNLNDILNDVLIDFQEIIYEKNAEITIEKIPVLDTIPSQIRQLFQNLISNALKFTQPGIIPQIYVSAERIIDKDVNSTKDPDGPYLRLTVSDNGIGFDEKFLDRIFIIFQRLNNRTSYEGTGIGLAIAKKIIDKHNGLISARSSENKGASFVLILPLKQNM